MQNRALSPAGVSSNIVLAKPDCPLCKMGMRPVQAMPVLFSHDLDEVVYVCDECGQRTKRTPDLAPLGDGHLDGRDLLRRRIIDDGARKVLTTPNPRTGCRSRRARNK